MSDAPVWLAQATFDRLRAELDGLLRQRADTSSRPRYDRDDADQLTDQHVLADRRDREQRIRALQTMLSNAVVGEAPPDDGIAEPGMVLTVRHLEDGDTESFLFADREESGRPDVEICSPSSPLGRALSGAREGTTCEYRLPDGQVRHVRLERAVPYDDRSAPSPTASPGVG